MLFLFCFVLWPLHISNISDYTDFSLVQSNKVSWPFIALFISRFANISNEFWNILVLCKLDQVGSRNIGLDRNMK